MGFDGALIGAVAGLAERIIGIGQVPVAASEFFGLELDETLGWPSPPESR